jgi:hypothetical protein
MEEKLQRIYIIMDYVFFGVVLALESYVIGYKLRFKMDKAGYTILITQLIVMIVKLF